MIYLQSYLRSLEKAGINFLKTETPKGNTQVKFSRSRKKIELSFANSPYSPLTSSIVINTKKRANLKTLKRYNLYGDSLVITTQKVKHGHVNNLSETVIDHKRKNSDKANYAERILYTFLPDGTKKKISEKHVTTKNVKWKTA